MFLKDHRPWGWFESLIKGNNFQVKLIYVKPGGSISLQYHNHRSEHWVVVEGSVRVTLDEETKTLSEGGINFYSQKSIHRMENETDIPMTLIEIQTGSYLEKTISLD